MRPPYFHDGLTDDLDDVVRVCDRRFGLGMSAGERRDRVAFLEAL